MSLMEIKFERSDQIKHHQRRVQGEDIARITQEIDCSDLAAKARFLLTYFQKRSILSGLPANIKGLSNQATSSFHASVHRCMLRSSRLQAFAVPSCSIMPPKRLSPGTPDPGDAPPDVQTPRASGIPAARALSDDSQPPAKSPRSSEPAGPSSSAAAASAAPLEVKCAASLLSPTFLTLSSSFTPLFVIVSFVHSLHTFPRAFALVFISLPLRPILPVLCFPLAFISLPHLPAYFHFFAQLSPFIPFPSPAPVPFSFCPFWLCIRCCSSWVCYPQSSPCTRFQ